MEKSTSKKISVGIFVIVGTILLITALYFVGKKQHLFNKNIQLIAVFSDVSGLQLGNNVRYSGVDVGTVSKIEMKEEGKISVELSIDEDAAKFIKKDAVASIGSDGLVGSMVVNIVPGENKAAKMVVSGDQIQVKSKITIDEILETFSKTNESAALITSDLAKITQKVVEGKGTLGAILSDTLLENDVRKSVAGMKRTAESATKAMDKVNALISKINYDESAAAVLLSDPKTRVQIQNVFTNLDKSGKNINKVSESLNDYVQEIKTGKGTINYLTQDQTLVKNIDSTAISVKESADKFNQNMEALKHNFLFRGYFRKLERKERKEKEKNDEKLKK
ncbi:MlaD family protein [Frigoriflavimonas asaccharolytica]|uniref:Phospholipid/cholesterol/gamma-HCH transport system substrate-binding protein n=1 Tax=Frigoriflavimonas asaccharolytica TaxID=2735899 RepID=A0A8J8K9L8_9FLAO|nr:MlaD family protein [Frigoriflavimonas asaccharolytica]NRS93811.1 phospholipid/cholesterol/gamma-HCH transport system substrate-binding protein [Frigoriflavimonas asaccharolytica]